MIQLYEGQNRSRPQGFYRYPGTVLRGAASSRSYVVLFLRELGVLYVSAPGCQGRKSSRFGGSIEPLVWGYFSLYKSPSRFFLQAADVKEDFLKLRREPRRLRAALEWSRELASRLPFDQSCDDVLALFWGALKDLESTVPQELVQWRFFWRWLKLWGLAPSLLRCGGCGKELEGARWSEEGLVCPDCIVHTEGKSVAPLLLRDYRAAAMLDRSAFWEWGERYSIEGSSQAWRDDLDRMKKFFEGA